MSNKKMAYLVMGVESGNPLALRHEFDKAITWLKDYIENNRGFSGIRYQKNANSFSASAMYAPPSSTMLPPCRAHYYIREMEIE